jgi:hypothetical protein
MGKTFEERDEAVGEVVVECLRADLVPRRQGVAVFHDTLDLHCIC